MKEPFFFSLPRIFCPRFFCQSLFDRISWLVRFFSPRCSVLGFLARGFLSSGCFSAEDIVGDFSGAGTGVW